MPTAIPRGAMTTSRPCGPRSVADEADSDAEVDRADQPTDGHRRDRHPVTPVTAVADLRPGHVPHDRADRGGDTGHDPGEGEHQGEHGERVGPRRRVDRTSHRWVLV